MARPFIADRRIGPAERVAACHGLAASCLRASPRGILRHLKPRDRAASQNRRSLGYGETAMTYPTLLLLLDDELHAGLRLERTLRIASAIADHVTGVSPTRPAPGDGAGVLGLDALTAELGAEERRARRRELAFNTMCESLRVRSYDVVEVPEEASRAIIDVARFCDLVLLQQPNTSKPGHAQSRATLDHVLIHGPRPTLVVPHAGRFETIGTRMLLAWDGSREAARAAADALPFLRRASTVHVVNFDRYADNDDLSSPATLEPVCNWLKRHGIAATIDALSARIGVGDALLSHAADLGVDLLVMGAWGHSRLAERLLGGVTRTVLETTTVPVLFSH
jgi:nucleotide-binding universal stress UspA family protein